MNELEHLIAQLREYGLAESEIQRIATQLTGAQPADSQHACRACGRSSGTSMIQIEIAGQVTYTSPTRWIYCYRERGKPLGLCDQCFHLGRFDGFTPEEIAYFREGFEREDADDAALE